MLPRSFDMDFNLASPSSRERSSRLNSLMPSNNNNIEQDRHPLTPKLKRKLSLNLDLSLALDSKVKDHDDDSIKKSSAKDKGLDSKLSLSLQYPPLSSSLDDKLRSKSKRREDDSSSSTSGKLARTSLDLSL